MIVGYRGYGHSEGSPSELGIEEDAYAIFQFTKSYAGINANRIYLLGSSLGGAVAI